MWYVVIVTCLEIHALKRRHEVITIQSTEYNSADRLMSFFIQMSLLIDKCVSNTNF